MINPDDIGEKRPVNHTPTIALAIAAVLFLIVGAMSYRDFVRTSYEKEFAEKEARLMQRQGFYPDGTPLQQAYPQTVSPGDAYQTTSPAPQAPAPTQAPAPVLYDALGNPMVATGSETRPQGNTPAFDASLPVPNDPEIDRIRQSLDQAREQTQRTEQRYNDLAGNVNALAREAAAAEQPITAELPDFLREAVENPPGGNPEVEARLERMRAQIVSSPSLAKVTSYDKDWGVVTFNAGTVQGVKVSQRFAVRRGINILGWVKVDQVEADQSIAILVTKNRDDDTAAKPEVGDDLIDFELF